MRRRWRFAVLSAIPLAAVVAVIAFTGETSVAPRTTDAEPDPTVAASVPAAPGRVAREDCSTRSEADFPGAFTSPSNLVAGPLVLVGGAYTDEETVREFGGNKFPLLVAAGHTVTVRIPDQGPRTAGLAYGPLPQGETGLRDTYDAVTFVSCRPGRPTQQYSPNGPSGSHADGKSVTFWSGFVLTRAPACVPLDVYIDGSTSPRRVGLALGRRCGR